MPRAPRKKRYAAPAILSATRAGSHATRRAVTPVLVARAQMAWPLETPTAVKTPARRPSDSVLRTVSTVSCPGVAMTNPETPRKAGTPSMTAVIIALPTTQTAADRTPRTGALQPPAGLARRPPVSPPTGGSGSRRPRRGGTDPPPPPSLALTGSWPTLPQDPFRGPWSGGAPTDSGPGPRPTAPEPRARRAPGAPGPTPPRPRPGPPGPGRPRPRSTPLRRRGCLPSGSGASGWRSSRGNTAGRRPEHEWWE